MATMKVERTAEGQEIVYHVSVHPEVFNWLDTDELADAITIQFRGHLDSTLQKLSEELE